MNLLEYLAQETHLYCLSDLKFSLEWQQLLKNIEPCIFTVSDWNEAVYYLTNETIKFDNSEQSKQFLVNYTNESRSNELNTH